LADFYRGGVLPCMVRRMTRNVLEESGAENLTGKVVSDEKAVWYRRMRNSSWGGGSWRASGLSATFG